MAAAKEVPRAHTRPESLVLMASPSERQSRERGQLRVARRMAETGAPVKELPDVQLTLKGRDADRGGNRSQIRRQGSALLPRYVAEARTQQVHNAQLGPASSDTPPRSLPKPFQPVHTSDENVRTRHLYGAHGRGGRAGAG
jgi:hypothetical protein